MAQLEVYGSECVIFRAKQDLDMRGVYTMQAAYLKPTNPFITLVNTADISIPTRLTSQAHHLQRSRSSQRHAAHAFDAFHHTFQKLFFLDLPQLLKSAHHSTDVTDLGERRTMDLEQSEGNAATLFTQSWTVCIAHSELSGFSA